MKILSLILMATLMNSSDSVLYDFNSAQTAGQWYSVTDDVMGGSSISQVKVNTNGTATFSGVVRAQDNVGFASARSEIKRDLSPGYKGVVLRVKGDGKTYSLRFRTSIRLDDFAYEAKMKTVKGEWQEFRIPFANFEPTFRGYSLRNKPKVTAEEIAVVVLYLGSKQFGDFSLDIDWIKFY